MKASKMRSIGFRSNLLVAIAAAIGVIAALGRPWYGPDTGGPEEDPMPELFGGIGRAFTEPSGITGWDALTEADRLIAGLAGATVVFAALTLLPALAPHVQTLARWTALATFGVVAVKLIDEPGANSMAEPRYGILVALCAAFVLVASTMSVAGSAPRRRYVKPATYTPPPAPAPANPPAESSWGPPQF